MIFGFRALQSTNLTGKIYERINMILFGNRKCQLQPTEEFNAAYFNAFYANNFFHSLHVLSSHKQ